MAVGDMETGSPSYGHPSSYHSSSVSNSQMLPPGAALQFPQSNQAANFSDQWSLNSYLPSSFHQQQLKESTCTQQSCQFSGTRPLATTSCPSSAMVRPAAGGHREFKDEEGEATGCHPEVEADGAVGAIGSSSEANDLLKTKPALEVIDMGFSSEVVKTVIHLKVVETGNDYMTADALLDAVMAYQIAMNDEDGQGNEDSNNRNSLQLDSVHQQNLSASDTTTQQGDRFMRKKKGKVKSPRNGMMTSTGNQQQMNNDSLLTDGDNRDRRTFVASHMQSPFSLKEENKKMKTSRLCKICMENEIRIVFLPCGHFVCCAECSSLVQNCTTCHRAVKGSVKVFLG